MTTDNPKNLDALIDEALRTQPERDVPFGFQRRTTERLRLVVLLDREVAQFRAAYTGAVVFLSLLGLGGGLAWFVIDVPELIARAVPGALGFYDQFMLFVAANAGALGGLSLAAFLLLTGGFALLERARVTSSSTSRGF